MFEGDSSFRFAPLGMTWQFSGLGGVKKRRFATQNITKKPFTLESPLLHPLYLPKILVILN